MCGRVLSRARGARLNRRHHAGDGDLLARREVVEEAEPLEHLPVDVVAHLRRGGGSFTGPLKEQGVTAADEPSGSSGAAHRAGPHSRALCWGGVFFMTASRGSSRTHGIGHRLRWFQTSALPKP